MILSLALAGTVLAPMTFPDLVLGEPMGNDTDQNPQPEADTDYSAELEEGAEDIWLDDDEGEVEMAAEAPIEAPLQTIADMLQIDFDAIVEREGDLSVFDHLTFADALESALPHTTEHNDLAYMQTIVDGFNKDEDLLVIEVEKGQSIALQYMTEVAGSTRFDFSNGASVLVNGVTGVDANIVHFAEI